MTVRFPAMSLTPGAVPTSFVRGALSSGSIAIFFLIYWWLPNGPTSPRKVLPAAIGAGIFWEVVKYFYFSFLLPHLKYGEIYGPFSLSVTLVRTNLESVM